MTEYIICFVEYEDQLVYKTKYLYTDDGEPLDGIEGWFPESVCTSPLCFTKCVSEDKGMLEE